MDNEDADTVTLRSYQRPVSVHVPRTNVDSCIRVSRWRAMLTALSIALVVTDIPRTGLTLSLSENRERVGPGVIMCWGPYEYHVAHLSALEPTAAANASCDGVPLAALDVWSYKFDSLSIAPRAIAQHLSVPEYPPCVLYREPCTTTAFEPATVFGMFDGLVTALQREHFAHHAHETRPFVFFTKSNWIDRLHQFVFRRLTKNPETRLHSAFHRSSRGPQRQLNAHGLCDRDAMGRRAFPDASRPIFCDHPVGWTCDHPIEPTGERTVAIWDHIALRVDDLQRRYPHLELDLTIFVTTDVQQAHSDRHVIRSVTHVADALEITTLVRGRRCDALRMCKTAFVDDYRYERVVLEGDEAVWTWYLWVLRGSSQGYVWLRVLLLVLGCYRASAAEQNHESVGSLIATTCRTIFKIPGHTIVYGSWLPIIGYALAHHFDSGLNHMIAEYAWSSVGGFYNFHPVDYVLAASIQMRNLWMIMILWKLALGLARTLSARCQHSRHPERCGVLSFRPGWVGLISWLTTFSMVRSLGFRDTHVVSVVELPRFTDVSARQRLATFRNYTDYGIRFDLKATFAAGVLVIGFALFVSTSVQLVTGRPTSLFLCRTFYVPLSTGRLWLRSAIDTYWSVTFPRLHKDRQSRIEPIVGTSPETLEHATSPTCSTRVRAKVACRACSQSHQPTPLHWRSTQGCATHEHIFDVRRRTKEMWSLVRLMNIANMTDPIALFRLYVVGKPLFVYRLHGSASQPAWQILLPMSRAENHATPTACPARYSANNHANWLTSPDIVLEFVAVVNSRDVPWHVLVNCG